MTTKGRVTIPKKVRDALGIAPSDGLDCRVNPAGQVVVQKAVVQKAGEHAATGRDRFDAVRGKAQVPWRTDALMALLRGTD